MSSKLLICLLTFGMACGPSFAADKNNLSSTKSSSTTSRSASKASYVGPKQVISVLPFDNKVKGYGAASAALGEGMTEILTTELVNSGRFVVVERGLIQNIVKEQELGMTGLVNQETAVATGNLSGAQFFIKGAVTEFNPQAGGGGISLGWDLGKVTAKAKSAYLAIDVRIVDNSTGQIHASYNASAKARSGGAGVSTNLTHSGEDFGLGISGFASTAVGKAVRSAIQDVMGFIIKEANGIPWQGSVIKADGGRIFINRGSNSNIKSGDQLNVYSKGESLIDPETGFNLGSDEMFLCKVSIANVRDKFSIARQGSDCSAQIISRGDIIRYQ